MLFNWNGSASNACHDGQVIEADTVLYATGRGPNTRGLGLQEAGVTLGSRGEVVVDAQYRSSVPSILAVGDVTDRVQLTPVALAEAMVVVDQLFGSGQRTMVFSRLAALVKACAVTIQRQGPARDHR